MNGGSGNDWAMYRDSTGAVTIDLSINLVSGGEAQGDTLTGIENLFGGEGNDKLSGDGAANQLVGWRGTDVLRGNGGADMFSFTLMDMGLGRDADRIMDFSQAEGDQIALLGPAWATASSSATPHSAARKRNSATSRSGPTPGSAPTLTATPWRRANPLRGRDRLHSERFFLRRGR